MSASGLKIMPAALAVAFALPTFAFAAAGRIDFAVGDVRALSPDGRSRPLAKGDEFDSGDTIETGGNGRVWLRFTDGAQVSLQPKSEYRIDDYKFNGKADGEERGFFSLLKGGLRTITGLVGRTNRKNYGVTTTVATIGIRGTEYSITYGNSITVSTGEGSTVICNAAGCITLVGGQTGYVAGANIKPVIVTTKADLPPEQPQEISATQFSVTNNTNSSGQPSIIGIPPMQSGPGYAAALAYMESGSPIISSTTGTAIFDSSSRLTQFISGNAYSSSVYMPGASAEAHSDGVVGWGRWATGTVDFYYYGMFSGSYPLNDLHYIGGIPTTAADMTALQSQGVVATYTMIGATAPTSDSGATGTVTAASIQANFGTGVLLGQFDVSISGRSYANTWNTSISASSPNFNASAATTGCAGSCSTSVQGFFAGAGATRAGTSFEIQDSGASTVHGAIAYRR